MTPNCQTLEDLWQAVLEINQKNFPENTLMPIVGNGKTVRPKVMFVFINPTHLNISSNPHWKGPRFPFIGTKQIWRIFYRAGMLDDSLMNQINNSLTWSVDFTHQVLNALTSKSFYLTNIVKWTGYDATLPDARKVNLFLPVLEREIEIVQPQYIVTFGLIPFWNVTKERIKLREYYEEVLHHKRLKFFETKVGTHDVKIIPCYFPVGRGDPKRAVEILKMVNQL